MEALDDSDMYQRKVHRPTQRAYPLLTFRWLAVTYLSFEDILELCHGHIAIALNLTKAAAFKMDYQYISTSCTIPILPHVTLQPDSGKRLLGT